jgi:hypothetical protein
MKQQSIYINQEVGESEPFKRHLEAQAIFLRINVNYK